jgi:mycothiol synthase
MADTLPAAITRSARPDPAEQEQVLALVDRAASTDGHRAVNDAGLLALRHPAPHESRPGPIHVLAHDPQTGDLVGYAQSVWEESGPVAALVVDPDQRRRGIGSALWRALAASSAAPLRVWATGNSPAAQALAASQGLTAVRTLLVLCRSLSGDLPPSEPPAGIAIRTFRPGDEDGWLAANARAFAAHPEQGAITRADLDLRMAESWFDPAGLFLAVRSPDDAAVAADAADAADSQIVGFHWTKREHASPTGEVYVLGVDPTAGVRGIGTALLGAGLVHLRDSGAATVELYVEADNVRALSLYRRYGFDPVTADVMYAARAEPASRSG